MLLLQHYLVQKPTYVWISYFKTGFKGWIFFHTRGLVCHIRHQSYKDIMMRVGRGTGVFNVCLLPLNKYNLIGHKYHGHYFRAEDFYSVNSYVRENNVRWLFPLILVCVLILVQKKSKTLIYLKHLHYFIFGRIEHASRDQILLKVPPNIECCRLFWHNVVWSSSSYSVRCLCEGKTVTSSGPGRHIMRHDI